MVITKKFTIFRIVPEEHQHHSLYPILRLVEEAQFQFWENRRLCCVSLQYAYRLHFRYHTKCMNNKSAFQTNLIGIVDKGIGYLTNRILFHIVDIEFAHLLVQNLFCNQFRINWVGDKIKSLFVAFKIKLFVPNHLKFIFIRSYNSYRIFVAV